MTSNMFGNGPDDLSDPSSTPEGRKRIRELCKNDILFWINQYGKTYDPRAKTPDLPFKLYPYQENLVESLLHHIRDGEDLLIEKSRDMGVSWLVLLVFQWLWLFHPGSNFLLGSRKADYVDRLGDISTLMEKLRYNLYRQPEWLLPEGFKRHQHDHYLKLVNPENGNSIVGESSNANFARGGRYKAILMDEFAYWQTAEMSYASAGQSSPCRIVVSTPHGNSNKFAELRFNSSIHIQSIHWSLHPTKDAAWYELQKRRMTEDEVARELDINYQLSSRDRVFREFTVKHRRELQWNPFQNVIRSWDFGYHCPAVLFMQIDPFGRLRVLQEIVGERVQLRDFAQRVIDEGNALFPGARYEDYADPAGGQKSDKSEYTSLEILNQMGIYPAAKSYTVFDGIELLRQAMTDIIEEIPGLIVHERCKNLIAALEGGYRYAPDSDRIIQKHPYEDVMDCLRYVACHKLKIKGGLSGRQRARFNRKPSDPYTKY